MTFETLSFGELTVHVVATPGHTRDSVCFVIDNGEAPFVFTGDTLLAGNVRTFVSAFTGSVAELLHSLAYLEQLSGVVGYPGHGCSIENVGETAKASLEHQRRHLSSVAQRAVEGPRALIDSVSQRYGKDRTLFEAAFKMLAADVRYLEDSGKLPAGSSDLLRSSR